MYINKSKSGIYLHDLLFFLLLTFTFLFTRNLLCNILMIVFCGYTMIRMFFKRSKIEIPYFVLSFFIFIFYGALNTIFGNAIDQKISQNMVVSLIINLIMMLFILQYILMSDDIKKVLRLFSNSIFCVSAFIFLSSFGSLSEGRLGSMSIKNPNGLAMLAGFAFFITLFFLLTDKKRCWFELVKAVLYVVIIMLTGSRKGMLIIVLGLLIVAMFFSKKHIVRNVLVSCAFAVGLYFIVMHVDVFYNILGSRIEELISMITTNSSEENSLNNRHKLIEIGMEYIKKKPWTGYGLDCFKLVSGIESSDGKYFLYSHNNYVELLFGGGIIGLVLYYIPFLSLLIKMIKNARINKMMPFIIAIYISKLSIEYAYVSYYEREDIYIVAILLGVTMYCSEKYKGSSKNVIDKKTVKKSV